MHSPNSLTITKVSLLSDHTRTVPTTTRLLCLILKENVCGTCRCGHPGSGIYIYFIYIVCMSGFDLLHTYSSDALAHGILKSFLPSQLSSCRYRGPSLCVYVLCMNVCIYECIYVCTYVSLYVMYVCIFFMYVCMYVIYV